MKYARNPSQVELNQFLQLIVQKTDYSEKEATDVVENELHIAVFDDYIDGGYSGRLMIVVGGDSWYRVFRDGSFLIADDFLMRLVV